MRKMRRKIQDKRNKQKVILMTSQPFWLRIKWHFYSFFDETTSFISSFSFSMIQTWDSLSLIVGKYNYNEHAFIILWDIHCQLYHDNLCNISKNYCILILMTLNLLSYFILCILNSNFYNSGQLVKKFYKEKIIIDNINISKYIKKHKKFMNCNR